MQMSVSNAPAYHINQRLNIESAQFKLETVTKYIFKRSHEIEVLWSFISIAFIGPVVLEGHFDLHFKTWSNDIEIQSSKLSKLKISFFFFGLLRNICHCQVHLIHKIIISELLPSHRKSNYRDCRNSFHYEKSYNLNQPLNNATAILCIWSFL